MWRMQHEQPPRPLLNRPRRPDRLVDARRAYLSGVPMSAHVIAVAIAIMAFLIVWNGPYGDD